MSDPLSDAFRANVIRIAEQRQLNLYRLGLLVFPEQPEQARVQLVGRRQYGITLKTVHRYAIRLGVPAADLITDQLSERIVLRVR